MDDLVHNLYFKAELLKRSSSGSYTLKVHSIRNSLKHNSALVVQSDYVDYMTGHTIDIYHDIQMNGIVYIRNVYGVSELAITPKTQISKIDALKEIIRAWGLNPEKILTRKAMSKPHRTIVAPQDLENNQIKILCDALKT